MIFPSGRIRFVREYLRFRRMASSGERRFPISWSERHPCLHDRTAATAFDRHYVFHPAWAARVLACTRPTRHVDISSTVDFCATVSAFLSVEYYDFRPAPLSMDNLTSGFADLVRLPFESGSISSLSCMHVVEHIGLGRYGDPLDPDGDRKAMAELARVLAPGGALLFVVPVGAPRICFNAHRVYAYGQILDCFRELELVEFALVPDDPKDGDLIRNASREMADAQKYGCGCFWFRSGRP